VEPQPQAGQSLKREFLSWLVRQSEGIALAGITPQKYLDQSGRVVAQDNLADLWKRLPVLSVMLGLRTANSAAPRHNAWCAFDHMANSAL
jgi:hypothetical protein